MRAFGMAPANRFANNALTKANGGWKMKANELMIGDWVQHPVYMGNLVPCRVVGISTEITAEFETGARKYEALKFAQPIPLTNKILELNGWQYGDWGNECENDEYFTNEIIDFDLHINDKKEFEIRCVDAVNITLKYVHELQHALRLCGIEKDIEI